MSGWVTKGGYNFKINLYSCIVYVGFRKWKIIRRRDETALLLRTIKRPKFSAVIINRLWVLNERLVKNENRHCNGNLITAKVRLRALVNTCNIWYVCDSRYLTLSAGLVHREHLFQRKDIAGRSRTKV